MGEHVDETRDVVPPRWRNYLYPIALAGGLLAAGYGYVTDEQAALWVGLAAALLGNSAATAYRPSKTLARRVPDE